MLNCRGEIHIVETIKNYLNGASRDDGIAVFSKPLHILCYGVFYQDYRFPGSKLLLIASILGNVLLVDFGASCFPAPKENEPKQTVSIPVRILFLLCFYALSSCFNL